MKPQFILCQALVCLSLAAQEDPVSTTANQGRFPIFEDSSASPEISNFKARLYYEATFCLQPGGDSISRCVPYTGARPHRTSPSL